MVGMLGTFPKKGKLSDIVFKIYTEGQLYYTLDKILSELVTNPGYFIMRIDYPQILVVDLLAPAFIRGRVLELIIQRLNTAMEHDDPTLNYLLLEFDHPTKLTLDDLSLVKNSTLNLNEKYKKTHDIGFQFEGSQQFFKFYLI
jgi:hypothetical protein